MPATIQKILKPTKYRAVDTSTSEQLVSQDLVTNSAFSGTSDLSGWTLSSDSPPTNASGNLQMNSDGSSFSRAKQELTTVIGATYKVSANVVVNGSSNDILIGTSENLGDLLNYRTTGTGEVAQYFVATGTTTYLQVRDGASSSGSTYSYVSVHRVESFGNNNHGQIYSGRALEFDGVADRLVSQEDYPYYDENSIAFWFNPDDLSGTEGIIGRNSGNANTSSWSIWYTAGNINCYVGDTSSYEYASYDVPAANTWYRVVAVFDHPNNNVKIYVNGVLAAEDTNSLTYANIVSTGADDIIIGALSSSSFFGGKLSDVQIWNKVWTQSDVTFDYLNPESLALSNGGTSLTESNLKLWYPMQDGHRGQQSYILDGANTGLGPELLTTTDLTTLGNRAIAVGETLNGWTNHNRYDFDSVTASSDGVRIISDGLKDDLSGPPSSGDERFQSFYSNGFPTTEGVVYRVEVTAEKHSGGNVQFTVMNGPVSSSVEASAGLLTESVTNKVFYFTANSNADSECFLEAYKSGGDAGDWTIKYASVKAVNDKHPATTVFYSDDGWNKADNYGDPSTDKGTNKWDPALISQVTTSPAGGTTLESDIALISTGGGQDAAHMGVNIIPGASSNGIGILLNNTTAGTLSSTFKDVEIGRNYRLDYIATSGSCRDTANMAVNNGDGDITTGNQNVRFNEGTTSELGGKVLNGNFDGTPGSDDANANSWTEATNAERVTSGGHSSANCMSLETVAGPTDSSINQTLTGLTAGAQYLLTFWAKGGGSANQSIRTRVQYDSGNVNLTTTDTNYVTATWKKFNYQFTASHTSATLFFYSPSAVTGTVLLDDVKVSKFEDGYIEFTAGHATNCYLYGKDMTTPDPTTSSTDIWNTSLTSNTTGWNTYLGGSIDGADGGGTDDGAMKCIRNEADGSNDLYFTRSDTITFEAGYKYRIQAGIRIPTSTGDYQASAGNAYITVDGIDGTVTAQRKALQASERNSYTTVVTILDLTSNDSSSDNTGKLLVRSDSALADDDFIHLKDVNVYRLEDIFLDNITFKEIGTATGWTKADQQLDIPQAALQSYNQLAWFNGKDSKVVINPTTSIWNAYTEASAADRWNSISYWIYSNKYDNDFNNNTMHFGVQNGPSLYTALSSNDVELGVNTGNGEKLGISVPREAIEGKWVHWVWVWKGNDNANDTEMNLSTDADVYAYLNGERYVATYVQGSNSNDLDTLADSDLTLATSHSASNYFFQGAITEVCSWKYKLTDEHVVELYNDGKAFNALDHSNKDYLTGYWRNNGLATWTNLVNPGTNDGTVTCSETLLLPEGVDSSRDNQGLIMNRQKDTNSLNVPLDGTDLYKASGVWIPRANDVDATDFDANGDGTGDFTVEFWFKFDTAPAAGSACMFTNIYRDSAGTPNYAGFEFLVDTNGALDSLVTFDDAWANNNTLYGDITGYNDNKWHHFVAAFDRSANFYLIVDKVVKKVTDISGDSAKSLWKFPIAIGGEKISGKGHGVGRQPYTGSLDDLKIYNRLLTFYEDAAGTDAVELNDTVLSGEVLRNYNAGKRSHK